MQLLFTCCRCCEWRHWC